VAAQRAGAEQAAARALELDSVVTVIMCQLLTKLVRGVLLRTSLDPTTPSARRPARSRPPLTLYMLGILKTACAELLGMQTESAEPLLAAGRRHPRGCSSALDARREPQHSTEWPWGAMTTTGRPLTRVQPRARLRAREGVAGVLHDDAHQAVRGVLGIRQVDVHLCKVSGPVDQDAQGAAERLQPRIPSTCVCGKWLAGKRLAPASKEAHTHIM
jgi:hypothetical protein